MRSLLREGNFVKKVWSLPLIAASLALAACGGAENDKVREGASGGDTSANLPMGLPLMKGATVVNNNNGKAGSGQKNAAAVLMSTKPVDEVYDFYVSALEDAGFDNSREIDVQDIRTITGSRDGANGMITVRPAADKTKIMIALNTEG